MQSNTRAFVFCAFIKRQVVCSIGKRLPISMLNISLLPVDWLASNTYEPFTQHSHYYPNWTTHTSSIPPSIEPIPNWPYNDNNYHQSGVLGLHQQTSVTSANWLHASGVHQSIPPPASPYSMDNYPIPITVNQARQVEPIEHPGGDYHSSSNATSATVNQTRHIETIDHANDYHSSSAATPTTVNQTRHLETIDHANDYHPSPTTPPQIEN